MMRMFEDLIVNKLNGLLLRSIAEEKWYSFSLGLLINVLISFSVHCHLIPPRIHAHVIVPPK